LSSLIKAANNHPKPGNWAQDLGLAKKLLIFAGYWAEDPNPV
jgi:hypothetical protein